MRRKYAPYRWWREGCHKHSRSITHSTYRNTQMPGAGAETLLKIHQQSSPLALQWRSHSCDYCSKLFATPSAFQAHMSRVHGAGVVVLSDGTHLTKLPAKRGARPVQIEKPDLAQSSACFTRHFEVLRETVLRVIPRSEFGKVVDTRSIRGTLATGAYAGPLATQDGAPPSTFFSIFPGSFLSLPVISDQAQNLEPGERGVSLHIPLKHFLDENYEMYHVGTTMPRTAPLTRCTARTTLMLAKSERSRRFGREFGIPVDMHENGIFAYSRERKQWSVATRLRTQLGDHSLEVSLLVADDIMLDDVDGWSAMDVSQVEAKVGRYVCPFCDSTFAQASPDVLDHIALAHEGIKFACDECPKSFEYRSGLAKHKRFKHRD